MSRKLRAILVGVALIAVAAVVVLVWLAAMRHPQELSGPTGIGWIADDGDPPEHGFLGIALEPSPPEQGVLIKSVLAGSGAAQAGVRAGDVVLAIDSQPVSTAADLQRHVAAKGPGAVVALTVRRETETQQFAVPLMSFTTMALLRQQAPTTGAAP